MLRYHFRVWDTQVTQGFGAGALGETQVIGVIDHAAGVGVFVIDADMVAVRALINRMNFHPQVFDERFTVHPAAGRTAVATVGA